MTGAGLRRRLHLLALLTLAMLAAVMAAVLHWQDEVWAVEQRRWATQALALRWQPLEQAVRQRAERALDSLAMPDGSTGGQPPEEPHQRILPGQAGQFGSGAWLDPAALNAAPDRIAGWHWRDGRLFWVAAQRVPTQPGAWDAVAIDAGPWQAALAQALAPEVPAWHGARLPAGEPRLAVALTSWRTSPPAGWVSVPDALQPPPALASTAVLLGAAALLALGTALALGRQAAPVERAAGALQALQRGQLAPDLAPTASDQVQPGEPGSLSRAAASLRAELRWLQALREERSLLARRQQQLLRDQFARLAATLDEAERAAVQAEIDALPATDAAREPQLSRLAGLLASLVDRVADQQRRLREAMVERARLAGLEEELRIARDMQQAILPRHAPPTALLAVDQCMHPAREVGGDFYDCFALPDGRWVLVVADVSGKGVPAAFFMVLASAHLRTVSAFEPDPATLVARVNDRLAADNDQAMFVTLFLALVDPASGDVTTVNAGHNPPLLRRADGGLHWLPSGRNPALGVVEGLEGWQVDRLRLEPGDGLLLYTDGVTEAIDPTGALFGEQRLAQAVEAAAASPVEAVRDAVRAFEAGAPPTDDLTLLWCVRPASLH